MKRSIKLAVAAAVALSATSAFATNGDHLIGTGAKARGMGGVGIGMSHGAESALTNPALISTVKGTEVSFGGTIFMPDVESTTGEGFKKSNADLSVIPEVSLAQKVSENFTWGIGMFGTAGMGVDYRSQTGGTYNNYKMVTNLQLMQFAVPLAYSDSGVSVGIAPVLQYGSLDINYRTPAGVDSTTQGVAQDFGAGYNIGLAYETNGLTVGVSYKSAIDMVYDGQLSKATVQFGMNGGAGHADNLEQPAEIGAGLSYTTAGHTFAFDYKRIKWSDAKGYKTFGWDDQNVYMFGYQYAQDNWALRAGYNYAKSPIKEQFGTDAAAKNMFNLLGFPGIVEKHYTVGGSYAFTKMTSLDLAYVYADEKQDTFATTGMTADNKTSTKHSQQGISAQLNFNF
ncbi:MAG: outer membrane protein transport protein [Campylobacterota bacterium]